MIIRETLNINSGLLFHGRRLIGVADGGKIEYKYFVPDRFMYEPVHDNEDNSANDETAQTPYKAICDELEGI